MLSMLALSEDGAIVVGLGFNLLFGVICAIVASGRGRSALGWFFIGVFTQCIGLILLLVLPDAKLEEERQRRTKLENRRLKEQLQKERHVSDQRHQHVERRLGAHDQALGLDTSTPPALAHDAPAQIADGNAHWYYARDNERQGPVTAETIRHLLQAGAINDGTLLWAEGMKDWAPLRDIGSFGGDPA